MKRASKCFAQVHLPRWVVVPDKHALPALVVRVLQEKRGVFQFRLLTLHEHFLALALQ
ncbi:hypothetical protein KCP71_13275 [Salmonella enterica subsp. enterica]|nr:hypothetical protein KCP71_13275 [Salmonella enterica subsp. enterica]